MVTFGAGVLAAAVLGGCLPGTGSAPRGTRDNSSTHTTPEVMEWLRANPRVKFHFTPTSATWLNQVEGLFSILTRRSLRRTSFASKAALRRHISDFLADWNRNPTPFVWTKPARTIIRHRRRMLARISRTVH